MLYFEVDPVIAPALYDLLTGESYAEVEHTYGKIIAQQAKSKRIELMSALLKIKQL